MNAKIEDLLIENNQRLARIEKLMSRFTNGLDPIVKKMEKEIKKGKQTRNFECSKYFDELQDLKDIFKPSESAEDYLSATEIKDYISFNIGLDFPLRIVGQFLKFNFDHMVIHKRSKENNSMKRFYKITFND